MEYNLSKESDADQLQYEFEPKKVKDVVFELAENIALGTDGFPIAFFQQF